MSVNTGSAFAPLGALVPYLQCYHSQDCSGSELTGGGLALLNYNQVTSDRKFVEKRDFWLCLLHV